MDIDDFRATPVQTVLAITKRMASANYIYRDADTGEWMALPAKAASGPKAKDLIETTWGELLAADKSLVSVRTMQPGLGARRDGPEYPWKGFRIGRTEADNAPSHQEVYRSSLRAAGHADVLMAYQFLFAVVAGVGLGLMFMFTGEIPERAENDGILGFVWHWFFVMAGIAGAALVFGILQAITRWTLWPALLALGVGGFGAWRLIETETMFPVAIVLCGLSAVVLWRCLVFWGSRWRANRLERKRGVVRGDEDIPKETRRVIRSTTAGDTA